MQQVAHGGTKTNHAGANLIPRNQTRLIFPEVAKIATTRTEKLMMSSKANLQSRNQVPRFATTQAPLVECDSVLQPYDIHFSTPAAFVVFQRKWAIPIENIDKVRVE